jgi:hypothetical protein
MTMVALAPRRWAACLAGAALIAACSSADEPQEEVIAPEPELTGNPVMTQAPDGGALTPGEWVIGEDALTAHARFGPAGGEPVFAMECDVATQALTLSRAVAAPADAGGEQTFILDAGGQRASVDMAPAGGEPPMLRAEINKAMPIFQAFQPLDNVITVAGPDGEVLRMQGAPGIQRVIEACSRT